LIKKLLVEGKARFKTDQVLNHKWFKEEFKKKLSDENAKLITKRMRAFRYFSKLKKAALMYIASRCGDTELKVLREIFLDLDINKDGYVEAGELLNSLGKHLQSASEVKKIVNSIDTDHNGMINYTGKDVKLKI
jgi:calcium-dependent protein kinase